MYKDNWTQPWPMGSEIYPEVHENPRAFFSSSGPICLESSIQCPCGVGLHQKGINVDVGGGEERDVGGGEEKDVGGGEKVM